MNRYLLNISYIGTHFKSFTKTVKKDIPENTSVVGALEQALQFLKPKNPISVVTSSRTDTGVHALHSAVHVDLERFNGMPYNSGHIIATLNRSLELSGLALKINSAEMVPNEFHATKSVKTRTYLYRLAVIKPKNDLTGAVHVPPLEEQNRCWFLYSNNFDIKRVMEASKLLVGKHDFRTFMGAPSSDKQRRPSFALRTVNYIKIERGDALTILEPQRQYPIEYWNFSFNAKSYVYRQIRRMMGTLVAAAYGRITTRDVYEMLTIPAESSLCNGIKSAPPHGLYLTNVEFWDHSRKWADELETPMEQVAKIAV